jgi:hypothetical protein
LVQALTEEVQQVTGGTIELSFVATSCCAISQIHSNEVPNSL